MIIIPDIVYLGKLRIRHVVIIFIDTGVSKYLCNISLDI
jgi:hypothetical protein